MTAYFVSAAGNDSNAGTTPEAPWLTVDRVNHTILKPGDIVLSHGGHVFSDAPLEPSAGGVEGAPIVFAGYGPGRPSFPRGAWFIDKDWLTFDGLRLGPDGGLQGGNDSGHYAHHIDVLRCVIDLAGGGHCGLLSVGDDWRIVGNTIRNTGDSGLRTEGDRYLITGNQILNTGTDKTIPYGKHAIYLRASNAKVLNNGISGFSADGVSARYRNALIAGNRILNGSIGIGWFQYDDLQGLSRWTGNTFADLTDAGIYVSGEDGSGPGRALRQTAESFLIGANSYVLADGVPRTNLQPTSGVYYARE